MDDVITKINDSINLETIKPLSSYTSPSSSLSSTLSTSAVSSTPSSSDGGWSTSTILSIILIIVVLALLGVNIFAYLAEGTDYLGWIVGKFTMSVPETAKDIVDTTVTGVDLGVDVAAGAVKNAGDILASELDLKRTKLWKEHGRNSKETTNTTTSTPPPNNYKESTEDDNIQEIKKPGYCYIGSDRGYRSCIKVNRKDQCESNKVFPTMDVCINPELRM